MFENLPFSARLSAAVPKDFAEAVRRTAAARGITAADVVRRAVTDRLRLEGEAVQPLPDLARVRSPQIGER